jgi:hypothetical protein
VTETSDSNNADLITQKETIAESANLEGQMAQEREKTKPG